eukprot:scaffold5703_cov132-Cylindrotheca_fusiformis.AAC.3
MSSSSSSYFDVDAILAEEELIPCSTLFDFSHLAHLDPDDTGDGDYLAESSRIKMPLWAVREWAMLGFVRLSLPRHYGRKARERLEADPGDADLRKKNERYFSAGRMLVDLIEQSSWKVANAIAASPGWRQNARRTAHTRALEQVREEAEELKRTLLKTFAGARLRRTFDWALSTGGDDDVSHYLSKLTEMEQRLFQRGAMAVAAKEQWTLFGNRRLWMHKRNISKTTTPTATEGSRPVTPEDAGRNKRQRR